MSSATSSIENILIRAGAGAGKTTTLTHTVLDIAQNFKAQQQRWPKTIITTFTRKATQELRERLVKLVAEKQLPELEEFVARSSILHISTIHGVLGLYISRYAGHLGLNPQFKMLSAADEYQLIKKSFKKVISTQDSSNFDFLMDTMSTAEVLSAYRIYADYRCLNPNIQIMTLEDCQKALEKSCTHLAAISKDLVFELSTSEELTDKWSQAQRAIETLTTQKLEVQDFQERLRQVKESTKGLRATKKLSPAAVELFAQWKEYAEQILSENWNLDAIREQEHVANSFLSLSSQLFEQVWAEKIKQSCLSMSDLENLSLILLQNSPKTAEEFAASWDYWMIDEYQDTSPKQVELLTHLIGDKKKFIVGDPQQSIYLFRGARSEVFHQAQEKAQSAGEKYIEKMHNYRSEPALLNFFNDVFDKISGQFKPMQAGKEASPAKTEAQAYFYISDSDNEIVAALFRIQELLSSGAQPQDIVVLSRQNKALSNLALAAKQYGVPVHQHASSHYYERQEIKDALSVLRFLLNPHDNINFLCVLRSPWFFIPDTEILKFSDRHEKSYWHKAQSSGHSVIDKLKLALQNSEKLGPLSVWRTLLWDSQLMWASHYLDPSGRREANLFKLIQTVHQLDRMSSASLWDWINKLDSEVSLESGDAEGDASPVKEPARVNLMTIHASKGLQFDHVILLGCGDARIPNDSSMVLIEEHSAKLSIKVMDAESGQRGWVGCAKQWSDSNRERQKQEYDRLLYVALTRAKKTVCMTSVADPDTASWMGRLPYSLGEEATHVADNFAYKVKLADYELSVFQQQQESAQSVRELFKPDTYEPLSVMSVTEWLKLAEDQNQKVYSSSKPDDVLSSFNKAQMGTEIHRELENLKYSSIEEIQSRIPKDLREGFDYVMQYEDALFLHIIQSGFVEWGFGVQAGNYLIQGQIDLWGQSQDGQFYVCDYKTGTERYKDKAIHQLKFYLYALYKLNRIDRSQVVNLSVIYPVSKSVHTVQAPRFEELEQWVNSISDSSQDIKDQGSDSAISSSGKPY